MSRFQAGALVVYGNLGVHEVEAVGLRRFCDEPAREYYTLRPYLMNENKMGTVPVNKLLVSMATPMVLSMLVGALYNVVDSLFVSHYGENALSAVSYVLGNAIGIYGIWWSFFISETVTVVFALLHLAGTEKRELERIAPVL